MKSRSRTYCCVISALCLALVAAMAPVQGSEITAHFELGDSLNPEVPGTAELQPSSELPGPDWAEIFAEDGSLRDDVGPDGSAGPNGIPDVVERFHGRAALFLADDVSLGAAKDYTVRRGDHLDRGVLANRSEELGNLYLYVASGSAGGPLVYLGVERLQTGAATLEVELDQGLVRLGHGWPGRTGWELVGQQRANDVRLTLSFGADGLLTGGAIDGWAGDRWIRKASLTAEGCTQGGGGGTAGAFCAFRNGSAVPSGAWRSYEAGGQSTATLGADQFVEVGIDVGALLGVTDPSYAITTVHARTGSDVSLGYTGGN